MVAEQVGPVDPGRVGLDDRHVVEAADDVGEHVDEAVVDLDRGHRGAGVGERHGERAQPGADLEDVVTGPDAGEVGDATDRVGVGDEVLAEIAARGEPAARQEVPHRAARGHRRIAFSPRGGSRRHRRHGEVGEEGEPDRDGAWLVAAVGFDDAVQRRPLAELTTVTSSPLGEAVVAAGVVPH